MSLAEHVDYIIEETGMNSKDAIKEVAKLRSISKRDVYQAYHQ
jgi:16S rRNA (cytidine1402-2'-O)-methyltransferase